MNNTTPTQNLLGSLKNPRIAIPFILLIVFLVIIMFLIFFKVQLPSGISMSPKSSDHATAEIFAVVFFSIIVLILCVTLLPNLKEIKGLFAQISNIVYVLLYTIFLILFFTLTPSDFLNKYAKLIIPLTILLGVLCFYKGISQNYVTAFNINYERIKMILMVFCLITCYIIFYNVNPGGIIGKYFGYTSLISIITLVFLFLYTVILLTLPEQTSSAMGNKNILSNFSPSTIIGLVIFFIFIITMSILIYYYPGGFLNDTAVAAAVIIMLLLIISFSSILIAANVFPESYNKSANINQTNLFKRSLLALFGLTISGLVIYWLVTTTQNLSGQSGIITFILNLILILIFLGLIYKAINVETPTGNAKKSGFFNLIINMILYIPCIFSGTFDKLGQTMVGEYNSTSAGSIMMLCVAVGIFALYFTLPLITKKITTQGGKQLVNRPVYTDTLYSLGTYQELNGSDDYDYNYALSFWVFIDAMPPNTNASYQTYTSLLNFGDKPNVLYNGKTNTLMITVKQKDLQKNTKNTNLSFDKNGNRIVYTKNNVLLQKWNNIILNYNGGVLDIFINGELVRSNIDVVPYYTLDNLTIGQDTGIQGGICNVVYFKKPLTVVNIYYLYNLLKDKTPPISSESNQTIMVKQ
jgi:hypothetical protein